MRRLLLGLLAWAVLAAAYVSPASAGLIYDLNASSSFGAGTYGTVTLTQEGTNTVDILVKLTPGMGFVSTGAGDPLLFDINGNPAITISDLTTLFATGQTAPINPPTVTLIHADGSGDWEYNVTCGTACGTGGNNPNPGPLSFDVTAPGLTPDSFISNGTAFFAADICRDINPTNDSCVAGANTGVVFALGPPTTVPEPSTLLIFGAGILGLYVICRKRGQSRSSVTLKA